MTRGTIGIVSLSASVALALTMAYGCSDDAPVTGTTDAGKKDAPSFPDDGNLTEPVKDTGLPNIPDDGNLTVPVPAARATLAATGSGPSTTGTVDFVESNGQVAVKIAIAGGSPGLHGMHIHNGGSCDDAGAAAGGHWNPPDASHGFPDGATHHPGDFGNITVDDAGVGSALLSTTQFTIVGDGGTSAIGHAVIFHAGTDDGVSQPTGDSGARTSCGVVQRTN